MARLGALWCVWCMSGQLRNPLVKQLVYGLIGFCVLTGIVFAIIDPEGKLSFSAAVFISMIVVAAFGSPVLLVFAIARGSFRKHQSYAQNPEKTPSTEPTGSSNSKYWDGTFGDAFMWFFYGVCVPFAGLIGGVINPEKVHPAVGMLLAGFISLFVISQRVWDGKWPQGESSE